MGCMHEYRVSGSQGAPMELPSIRELTGQTDLSRISDLFCGLKGEELSRLCARNEGYPLSHVTISNRQLSIN